MRVLRIVIVLIIGTVVPGWAIGVGPISEASGVTGLRQEVGIYRLEREWASDNSDVPSTTVVQNAAYLQVDYTVDRSWIAFFRLGGANLLLEGIAPLDFNEVGRDMEGGWQAWGGLGVKGLLLGAGRPFSLGLSAEGRYFRPNEDQKTIYRNNSAVSLKMETNRNWMVVLGVPIQYRLAGATFYAGPCLTASGAELQMTTTGLGAVDRVSVGYSEDLNIGVVAGAAFMIGNTARISVDSRFGDSTWLGVLVNFAPFDY